MSLQKHRKTINVVGCVAIGLWVVVLVITLGVFFCGADTTASRWGQFGDAFGVVNALFSGLALLGVVAAVLLQREDLDASLQAQKDSAMAQQQHAKIAALAASLDAKRTVAEYLEETVKTGSGVTKIKDRPLELADVLQQVKKEVLEINDLLDRELKRLVPEYKAAGQ